MAQYDPQRSRTRHRKADDEGPAPVDALLGPDPATPDAPDATEVTEVTSVTSVPPVVVEPVGAVAWEPPAELEAVGEASSSGRRPLIWAAAAVVAAVSVVWLVLRRRRGGEGESSEG